MTEPPAPITTAGSAGDPQVNRGRRADAQRNVEAILEAGLAVLSTDPDSGMAAIARASGLTRTTVYAHFPSREQLLDALVARAMAVAAARVDAGEPEHGPPLAALRRVLAASWEAVDRHRGVSATAAKVLGADRMTAHHAPLAERLRALIERGQIEGAFRDDLPSGWLLGTYFALVHLAGDQVGTGQLAEAEAEPVLFATIAGAFVAPNRSAWPADLDGE